MRSALATHRQRLILAFFFLTAFLSYTWANHFPYFYHSDEESKALQLLYGYRNYWHPMLMLNLTKALGRMTDADHDAQSITMIGRYLSAVFSASGIVFFVQFALRRKGVFVGVLTGFLLLTLPLLFEVSHYCKEDPALFMGFGLTLLALDFFLTKPDSRNILILGFAVGVATSAKYPGAFLIAGILPVVALRCRKLAPVLFFLLAAIATILIINWEWMTHFSEVVTGIQRESSMLATGHDGVAVGFPHTEYWHILLYQHGWLILITALLGLMLTQRKGEIFSTEFVLGFSALIALVFMSYSAKISDRYLLPIMAITLYLAACGVGALGGLLTVKYRPSFYILLTGLLLWHPTCMLGSWMEDFRNDSRAEMAHWISTHLTKTDKLATSLWTRLPGIYPGQFVSGVAPIDYVADFGTLAELRKMGYDWVAVADVESRRFENPEQTGPALSQATFLRRRAFYEDLRAQSDLRWSAPSSFVYNLHPGLKLYQLRP